MATVTCKKSLYKSTYLKNAFTKGKKYELLQEDDFVWVRDAQGHEFNFARAANGPGSPPSYYIFEDYFR